MPKFVFLSRLSCVLAASFLMSALAGFAHAADLPVATGSPLVGIQFDDQPLVLPQEENFRMALLTASGELGRTCSKTESYGWRMKQNEQRRVDQIFSSTVDRLRGLGFVVETQSPSSVSRDITLFTADRPDKHFIFMWSAGEIGLVMVLCESSPPLINRTGTQSLTGSMPVPEPIRPRSVVSSPLRTLEQDKAIRAVSSHFTPIGRWAGSYTCMQGYTGGSLEIDSLKGENFTGTFRFYPTAKNRTVPAGSYTVYGQYDAVSHRILINPGKWMIRPLNFYNSVMVGSFDPTTHTFSGYFQGETGCTSFEARYTNSVNGAVYRGKADKESKPLVPAKKKKKSVSKKKSATAVSPAASTTTPAAATTSGQPPSPGITPDTPASSGRASSSIPPVPSGSTAPAAAQPNMAAPTTAPASH